MRKIKEKDQKKKQKGDADGGETWKVKRTRRHVESRTTAEVMSKGFSSSKTKISDLERHAIVGDKDVLWLQVSMVNSNRMEILDSIKNLKK